MSYIAESSRYLKTRLYEHSRATKNKDSNYATYVNTAETGHKMDFENVKILDRAKGYNHRLHLEAAHIVSNINGLNNNTGKREPKSIWKVILKERKTVRTSNANVSSNTQVTEVGGPSHTVAQELQTQISPANDVITSSQSALPARGTRAAATSTSDTMLTSRSRPTSHRYYLRDRN